MPLAVQIEQLKMIRCRRRELMLLDIDAANPIAFPLQSLDEATADKSAGAANHRSLQRRPPPAEPRCRQTGEYAISYTRI